MPLPKLLLILFFLSLPLTPSAQTFKKVYYLGGQASYSLLQDAKSKYLIVGGNGIGGQSTMSLNLLDKDGNSIWYKYGDVDAGPYNKPRAYATANGYTVIFMEQVNTPQIRFCFIEIDTAGHVLHTERYGRNNLIAMNSTEIPGGGYFLFARTYLGDSTIVVKVNSAGQLLWSKGYPSTVDSNNLVFEPNIIPASDGGFFLYGHCSVPLSVPNSNFIIRADSSGTVVWCKKYFPPFPFLDMMQTSDGGLVGVGGSYNLDPRIFKVDGNGQFLWGHEFDPVNQRHSLVKIREDSLGNLHSVGLGAQTFSQLGVINHTFDSLGSLITSNVLYWQVDDASDFILTNDGGNAVLSVYPASPNIYGTYLIKCDQNNKTGCNDNILSFTSTPFTLTDSVFSIRDSVNTFDHLTTPYVLNDTVPDTLVICQFSTAVPEIMSSGITIYPNPCFSNCILKVSGLDKGNYEYKIFAMSGRVVGGGVLNGGELRIDNSLAEGCYLLEVSNGVEILRQKLLKIDLY